jgi:hypothetical protein
MTEGGASSSISPVRAHVRRQGGLSLTVDPVSLAALAAAREAGMEKPTDIPMLPEADDLPLRLVCLEARVDQLGRQLARLERMLRDG